MLTEMGEDLRAYLSRLEPCSTANADWGDMPLQVTAYLTSEMPPLAYVMSVRALVLGEGTVLVIHNGEERHILPGGRVEQGESPLQTVHREVMEETGVEIVDPKLMAVIHFRHLAPRREGYRYAYPDFLQPVYLARAGEVFPERVIFDRYVSASEMVPVDVARTLPLDPHEHTLLEAVARC